MENRLIHTECPRCSKSFELDASLVGKKGKCDSCETKFIIEESVVIDEAVVDTRPVSPAKSSGGASWVAIALLLATGAGAYFYLSTDTTIREGAVVNGEVSQSLVAESEGSVKDVTAEGGAPVVDEPLKEVFPVVENFENVDIRAYRKLYPAVFAGWTPSRADQANEARNVGDYLGPLGVRVRPHSQFYQGRAAFAAIVPESIRTADGKLGLPAAEVVQIAPGSPSEGHLQLGDLIVGVEGEMLKSGDDYRPEWKFMHKNSRMLQLMMGEMIDKAQGRGDIKLTVLRYPKEKKEHFSRDLKLAGGRVSTERIAVNAGDEIRLIVETNGSSDHDHFAWLSPKLRGSKGELSLADEAKIKPVSAKTGWGKVSYGKNLSGNALSEAGIGVHGYSELVFVVPEGYDSFETAMQVTHGRADLKARVVVAKAQQRLPVVRKELWSGKAGNKNVGVQEFDIELPSDGLVTLESDSFDGKLGGDGTVWLDVVVEGDYGTKSLFEMPSVVLRAGYGRARISTEEPLKIKDIEYKQSLNLHAHGVATWKIPKGTKKIKGLFAAISHGTVQPKVFYTNSALPLTGLHKEKLVELRYPIGKTGSFSATYPKNCPKTDQTVKRQTEWLAVQQRENGSWPRLAGYTKDGWDTSWCALALMSSGDSKYDSQVRKAAYYIAYDSLPSDWIAERAMRLIFLGEYYLRTKDSKIVAGIQMAYQQVIACCKTDYMSGHKVNGFGYGIAGQHYGTGHLALALAVAKQTPIAFDRELVGGVIRHAGEVCMNGTYAYGRGRKMARSDKRDYSGGNAMSGPGLLGVQIGGGHKSAVRESVERMEASIGDGDNSHASSSLAFIFSSLALSTADEDVFLKHMQNFKYKMTIDDNWDGGFHKSHFPLDFQGGENVTANNIRSAGSILVLNSLKRNLSITGKKELWSKDSIETVAVSEWGGQVHSYYLRNWCIVNEMLGSQAPSELKAGIKMMHELPRTLELVPETRKLVNKYAPTMIDEILSNKSLSGTKRAYAIELLVGLDFKIYTSQKEGKQQVDLAVHLPLQQLNWLDGKKEEMYEKSLFPLEAKVEVAAFNLSEMIEFNVDSLKGVNHKEGVRKFKATKPLKDANKTEFPGAARITFKLGGKEVTYKRPMKFNSELSFSNDSNLRLISLKLKMAPRAIFQSQPLVISGIAFDCMFPKERMLEVVAAEDGAAINVHEGDDVTALISSDSFICGWVYELKFDKLSQVKIIKAKGHEVTEGSIEGDIEALYDFKSETSVKFKGAMIYDFGADVELNGLDAATGSHLNLKVWYQKDGEWVPVVWDSYSPHTNYGPTFPATKARLWKVQTYGNRSVAFKTLRFYFNSNMLKKHAKFPQMSDSKFAPEAR